MLESASSINSNNAASLLLPSNSLSSSEKTSMMARSILWEESASERRSQSRWSSQRFNARHRNRLPHMRSSAMSWIVFRMISRKLGFAELRYTRASFAACVSPSNARLSIFASDGWRSLGFVVVFIITSCRTSDGLSKKTLD